MATLRPHGAGVHIHPDEARTGRDRNGQSSVRVVAEHVDAHGESGRPDDLRYRDCDGGDGLGRYRVGEEGNVGVVLDDQSVEPCLSQRRGIGHGTVHD